MNQVFLDLDRRRLGDAALGTVPVVQTILGGVGVVLAHEYVAQGPVTAEVRDAVGSREDVTLGQKYSAAG